MNEHLDYCVVGDDLIRGQPDALPHGGKAHGSNAIMALVLWQARGAPEFLESTESRRQ